MSSIFDKNSQLVFLSLLLAKIVLMLSIVLYLVLLPVNIILWIGMLYAVMFAANGLVGLLTMLGLIHEHTFHFCCHHALRLCRL